MCLCLKENIHTCSSLLLRWVKNFFFFFLLLQSQRYKKLNKVCCSLVSWFFFCLCFPDLDYLCFVSWFCVLISGNLMTLIMILDSLSLSFSCFFFYSLDLKIVNISWFYHDWLVNKTVSSLISWLGIQTNRVIRFLFSRFCQNYVICYRRVNPVVVIT